MTGEKVSDYQHFSEFPRKETEMPINIDNAIKEIQDTRRKSTDADEKKEYSGGSYIDLKKAGYGKPDYEVHHMPADSITELHSYDGPAIAMDIEDHRKTASCGKSNEAKEYRKKQSDLIAQGKFMEAFEMDVADIREKFGDKYDKAIEEAREYAKTIAKKFEGGNHA